MNKLRTNPAIPGANVHLLRELNSHALQVNLLSEGRVAAVANAAAAPPAAGKQAHGDFVRNGAPVELGAAGVKYVIYGWICVSGGSPGAWVECRFLTGN